MKKLIKAGASFLAVLFLVAIWLWWGTPLAVEKNPAPVPGYVYFLKRQPDQLLAVMKQPADLSQAAEKIIHREHCPEHNCNVVGIDVSEGRLQYTAMYQGEWYTFCDGQPLKPEVWEPAAVPVGAENKRGCLVVDGREVLHFPGSFDHKFAPGYSPLTWIGGDRYLIFCYNGYTNGAVALAANFIGVGRNRGGCYLWDRETEKITRFANGSQFVWVKD